MKLKKATIENARNLRSCELDLSARCTVISGRNGTGKTTAQEAIQTALFGLQDRKKDRHVSKFDPDSIPTVELDLSLAGGTSATIKRSLLNKDGSWSQAGKTSRAKGKALELVLSNLGIPAAAANTLLCGSHANFANLLEEFPDDMQSVLTATCVQGSGPNPKTAVAQIVKDHKASKSKSAKNPGELTRLSKQKDLLEAELAHAVASTEHAKKLHVDFKKQSSLRKKLHASLEKEQRELKRLQSARSAMAEIIDCESKIADCKNQQTQWNSLNDRIEKAKRFHQSLIAELAELEIQFRVKKMTELEIELNELKSKIESCVAIESKIAAIQLEIDAQPRPDANDVRFFYELAQRIENCKSKIHATGLNFQLTSEVPHTVEVIEDSGRAKSVEVTAETPIEGVVGNVQVTLGDFTFSANGKENVGSLKREIDEIEKQQSSLLQKFDVDDKLSFMKLAEQATKLQSEIVASQGEFKIALGGKSILTLNAASEGIERQIDLLAVTAEDESRAGNQILAMSSAIEKRIAVKQADAENAKQICRQLDFEQPTDAARMQLDKQVVDVGSELLMAKAKFKNTGFDSAAESVELAALSEKLASQNKSVDSQRQQLNEAEKELIKIEKDLEHSGGFRRPEEIQIDLDAASVNLKTEETRQSARLLLVDRIESKVSELAEEVPAQLAQNVAEHLSRLTSGMFSDIELNANLSVQSVCQSGGQSVHWNSTELSTGERTLVALSIRIAIALSVADIAGSAFIMLDDSFTNLDPIYLLETERLLEELVNDDRVQVILFTCHDDWAMNWKKSDPANVQFVNFSNQCEYFANRECFAAVCRDNFIGDSSMV